MDSYWYAILHEVINKHDRNYFFRFTTMGDFALAIDLTRSKRKHRIKKKVPDEKIFLGPPFLNLYFTAREFDCLLSLLQGRTVKEVATMLELSPRTVEYYIKNMKVKMNCQTRSELLGKAINLEIFRKRLSDGVMQ